MYSRGIFKPMTKNTWQSYNPKDKTVDGTKIHRDWIKVDHSILIFGWGETKSGIKYWRVLNSWGPSWGEKGSFRLIRGENSIGIESTVEGGIPNMNSV
jgi:C1A family cysteine protease